ncbi:MAG TPA: hypothetical protein VFS21_23360 [Roseiflexaceae bacterium]|nr:hypothetical protein [Roseiflexaceae bacterium]
MSSTQPHTPTEALAQGIQSLKAGDTQAARRLLTQALLGDLDNLQGWLWLSGAVSVPGERKYCLERVLALDPQHAAARRGLATLPADTPSVSPLPGAIAPWLADLPEEPQPAGQWVELSAPARPPQPEQPAAPQRPYVVSPEAAGIVSGTTFSLPSRWSTPAEEMAPAPVTERIAPPEPAPVSPEAQFHAQTIAAIEQRYSKEDIDLVIKLFGSHLSAEQIARKLCEEYQLGWGDAKDLVAYVETTQRRKVAARQSPLLLGLGIVTLIGGILLIVTNGAALARAIDFDTMTLRTYANPRLLELFGLGVMMTLGSLIGMGQTIVSLFR